jgi:type II restriction enzyme
MAPREVHRGNVGEWSELYTLGYLLDHGGAFAADENQNPIPEIFHKILQVFIAETANTPETNYLLEEKEVVILIGGIEKNRVERSLISQKTKMMFAELVNGEHSRTFQLETGNNLLNLLQRSRISASSSEHENDLELVLEDQATGVPTQRVGFNIKSQIGGRSTLLNASGATNFVYRVVPSGMTQPRGYPEFEHGKHRQNLAKLYEAGYKLEFETIQNDIFYRNLTLLDMQFPSYLAKVLLQSYLTGIDSYQNVVQDIFDPQVATSRQPIFKLKEFLGAVAMGLRPSTEWDGDTTKFSGILVVKANGEIVFYYLYNRKNFEEHLYKNVAFERPSTSRHRYGEIYSESGLDKMKLNLQIRFTN